MTREAVNDVVAKGIVGLTRELPEDMGLVIVGIDKEGNMTMRATLNLTRATLGQIFIQLARTVGSDLYRGDAEGNPVPDPKQPVPEPEQPCSCFQCREARRVAFSTPAFEQPCSCSQCREARQAAN